MAVMIVIDAFDTDLNRTGLAEVLNHLVRMSGTGYTFEVTEQQRHCFFTIYEIKNFLILPALVRRSLYNRLIIIWTLS